MKPIDWRDYALSWLDAYACGQDLRAIARATMQAIRADLGQGGKLPEYLTFRKVAVTSLLAAMPPRPQDGPGRNGAQQGTDLAEAQASETRVCRKCGRELPLWDAFHSNGVGGRKYTCRDCQAGLEPLPRKCAVDECQKLAVYGSLYCSISHTQIAAHRRGAFVDEPDADGKVLCTTCHTRKPLEDFFPSSLARHRCKACCKRAHGPNEQRAAKLVGVIERRCRQCGTTKPIEEFHANGAGGRACICRACKNGHAVCVDCGKTIFGGSKRCKSCAGKHNNPLAPVPPEFEGQAFRCSKCRRDLPADAFYPSMLRKTSRWCRECHQASLDARDDRRRAAAPDAHKPAPTLSREERVALVRGLIAQHLDAGEHVTQGEFGTWSVDYELPVSAIREAYNCVLDERRMNAQGRRKCRECGDWYRPADPAQALCSPCVRIAEEADREAAATAV